MLERTRIMMVFVFLCVAALGSIFLVRQKNVLVLLGEQVWESPKLRPVVFNLTEFGGVGDCVTLNTKAFESAISVISKFRNKGGAQLNVPPGLWLTAPFNLTSHMTLFLAHGAVIHGVQVLFFFLLFLYYLFCVRFVCRVNT